MPLPEAKIKSGKHEDATLCAAPTLPTLTPTLVPDARLFASALFPMQNEIEENNVSEPCITLSDKAKESEKEKDKLDGCVRVHVPDVLRHLLPVGETLKWYQNRKHYARFIPPFR